MAATKNTKAFYNTEIPSDWEVKRFGDICKINGRIGYRGYTVEDIVQKGNGAITLSPSNFKNGKLDYSDCTYISWFKYEESPEIQITNGDILLVKTGSTFGKSALVDNLKDKATINPQIVVIKEVKSDIKYLSFLISNQIFQKQINEVVVGGAIPTLSQENILNFIIPLPPLPEQKAIAQVLSTADAAIHTTEKLIAQKELRKKWLMQQLLTGKKRLFPKDEIGDMSYEMVPIKFSEAFQIIRSYSISREGLDNVPNENSIYCIHYGDIHALYSNEFLDFSSQKGIPTLKAEISINSTDYLREGDIIMADASEDYDGVGEIVEVINLNDKKAIGGLHTIVLRTKEGVLSPKYTAYLLSSEKVKNELRKKATGTSVYSVSKTTLHSLSLIIHSSLKEQTAIAQVLQAADKEISLLKAKAEKLREQKKGLMQQLLTGKVRLNINEVKTA